MDDNQKMQIAYKQVSQFLKLYNQDLLKLIIPEDILDFINKNAANDYEYNITPKTFDPNTLTEEALAILLLLFRDYGADERQKDIINIFEKKSVNNNVYNYNNLLKKRNNLSSTIDESNMSAENNALVVYEKKGLIYNILQKIKRIFKRER